MVEQLQSLPSLKGIEPRPPLVTRGRAELAAIFNQPKLAFYVIQPSILCCFLQIRCLVHFWYLGQDSKILIEIKRVEGKLPPSATFSKRWQGFGEPFVDSSSNLIA